MKKEVIKVDKKYTYLSEFISELPTNCLLDKGRTGCGGTTIAIENDKKTIIAMPFVNLIKNKESQHEDVLCIYEGFDYANLEAYIKNNNKKKILVTYDSLAKTIDMLIELGEDPYKEYFLLIDEWHQLFKSYAFRNEAVKKTLERSQLFDEVTYMTATPIEEEFILQELKSLAVVEYQWVNTIAVDVKPVITNSPLRVVNKLVRQKIDDKSFGNLHFFVNSVDFIGQVLKQTKIDPNDVRIVCSMNNQGGGKSNQTKLGSSYKIAETTDPVKKINFYTSTAFEGCDIYDREGKTYIVSDKYKSHTLVDISTSIIQICGRIRDSKYNNEITHIFSETRYNKDLSFSDFKLSAENEMKRTKQWINEINDMSDFSRNTTIKMAEKNNKTGLNELYVHNIDGYLEFDQNLVNLDIVNFKICNQLYQSRITLGEEYSKYNYRMLDATTVNYTDILKENPTAKISFKDLFEEYVELRKEFRYRFTMGSPEDRQQLIEKEKPLIKEAYNKLGADKVEELEYRVSNIRRELHKAQDDISIDLKIIKCLEDEGVKVGSMPSVSVLKDTLQSIYETLDLTDYRGNVQKASATHIEKWFEAKKKSKKIDGKTVDHYLIKAKKYTHV